MLSLMEKNKSLFIKADIISSKVGPNNQRMFLHDKI